MRALLLIACMIAALNVSRAQAPADSAKPNPLIYSAARRASIMSAVLPGLGQAVNRKYWKIPIIYGGFAGLGYMFAVNNDQYQYYRRNLIAETDNDPATHNVTFLAADQLVTQKEHYHKLRDMSIIGGALLYLVNIIDANVDAHLRTFDVSDDLGLRFSPSFLPVAGGGGPGVTVSIAWH